MKKLSSRKLRTAHELISGFNIENMSLIFDVPSMLQYCMEKDLREILKQRKFTEEEIDIIIKKSGFKALPRIAGTNKVKFKLAQKDFESFQRSFVSKDF